MKKGFTLAELICVIIVIGILIILAIPSITKIVKNEQAGISESMNNVLVQAAELYIQDHSEMYTKTEGNLYCVSFGILIENEYLSSPLKDPVTDLEISSEKFARIMVQNEKFNYEIVDTCLTYGDINLDGIITTEDAVLLQKYLIKSVTLNEHQLANADVNVDGKLDVDDVIKLKKYLAGYDVTLGSSS